MVRWVSLAQSVKKKILTEFLPAEGLSVGVQAEENTLVDEGVLVLRPGALLVLGVSGADDGLNLVTVDETGEVLV